MSLVVLDFSKSLGRRYHAWTPATCVHMDPSCGTTCSMPAKTDVSALRGQKTLVVLDVDNLDFALQRHSLQVRYRALLNRLQSTARDVFPVAVLTVDMVDAGRAQRLRECGWRAIEIPREIVPTNRGRRIAGNADTDLSFELGVLSSVADYTAVLLGTGDGDLAISCARGLRRVRQVKPVTIRTLSVAGATSTRLEQRRDLFASSTLIGLDLLEHRSQEFHRSFNIREGEQHEH